MRDPRFPLILALHAALLLTACGPSLKPLPPVEETIKKAAAGDSGSVRMLVRYLTSPLEEESQKAFSALVEGKERSVPALLDALESSETEIAESAAGALGNIRDKAAVTPLTQALERPGFPRYVAVWALGEIGSEESVPVLIRCLGDGNPAVRKNATRALVKFGSRAVPQVVRALDDPNADIRHYALRVLGQSQDQRAVEPIMSRFGSLEAEVALWALGKLRARESLPLIVGKLGDPAWRIRLAAVQALFTMGDPRPVPQLKGLLDDPEWVVREWAARALENILAQRVLYRDQYGKLVVPYNLYR